MERPASSGRFAPRLRAVMPRDVTPNDNGPGPNTPPVSVGPTSSEGYGNTHVMYESGLAPPQAQAWSGWPVDWQVPPAGGEWSGYGYGRQSYIGNVSTAMTCVDLNSRQLASFPVYGVRGDVPFTLPEWATNPEPELYASWPEMMHEAANSLMLRGEAFFYATGRYAESSGGFPSRFVVVDPDVVEVEWVDDRRVYAMNGVEQKRGDILQVRYQQVAGGNRLRGISPLEWAGRSLVTSSVLEKYATDLASRGGIPWGLFSVPGELRQGQAREFRDAWVASRTDAMGAPGVLSGGATLQALTISPKDMALLELREFDERRICAAFGVPAYLVNVAAADSMTYSNVSQVYEAHWRQTLRTTADNLAQAFSGWLLPHGSRVEFNPDRYVQPTIDVRAQTWATLVGIGAMTTDEVRSAERLAPTSAGGVVEAQRLTGAAA